MRNRLVPIMLLKLPIMLWSNVPEFCLLCSNYAPYVSQYAPQIQRFLSVILHVYHYVYMLGWNTDGSVLLHSYKEYKQELLCSCLFELQKFTYSRKSRFI